MIYHWKDLDLEIIDFENHLDRTPSSEIIHLKKGEAREGRSII